MTPPATLRPMPTSRPRRLPAEQRRSELLDAARDVIGETGFDGFSVEAVVQRAGVTRPVLYDLFGDLDGLLMALFDREEEIALAPLMAVLGEGDPEGIDPEDFLIRCVETFLEAVRTEPATWRLILVPPQGVSPEVQARFQDARTRISARAVELLDWGVAARGGPHGLDHPLLARLLIAASEDAARLSILHPRRFTTARMASLPRTGLAMLPPDARPRGAPPPVPIEPLAPAATQRATTDKRMPRSQRRQQLLDVTLELIGDEGWEALSVEAIARRAGVNRTVVYRSFANLQLLLLALLRREDARTSKLLDRLIPVDATAAPAPDLLFMSLATFLRGVMDRPSTYRVVLQRPESTPVVLRKLVNRRRSALADRLRPLVEIGLTGVAASTAEIDVEVLTRVLLSTGEELARLALDDPEFPAERILQSAWTLLDLVPLR